MGFINLAEKTINAKLVYYGCGMGGKTTSLQVVHEIMCPRNEVQLVSIKTEEDATLLFDFLPIDIGEVEGFKVRIQGFTVPGQPKYRRMRKYVLSGADAVVFVVDSETSRLQENRQSFESLRENLAGNGLDESSIPIVLQYNKRDLEDLLPESQLDDEFRFRDDLRSFPSVATEHSGVFEAFVEAAGQLVEAKVRLYGLGRGKVDPDAVAEGARKKLWDIFDRSEVGRAQRDHGEAKGDNDRLHLSLTFDEDGQSMASSDDAPVIHEVETHSVESGDQSGLEPDAERDIRPERPAEVAEEQAENSAIRTERPAQLDDLPSESDAAETDDSDEIQAEEIEYPDLDDLDEVEELDELEAQGEVDQPDELVEVDVTPQSAVPLFSDQDFDLDPISESVEEAGSEFGAGGLVDDEEPLPALLDATVATNLQLVERHGELERYVAKLERKNRELVEVAQNVVHDLNRPLSAIRLMLSSMAKGYAGEISETAKQAVDNGLAATQQMDRLIRDVQDSSRLDFDGVHLTFDEVDLSVLIAQILEGLRYELDEGDVGVRVEPLPDVLCDEWMMTRVLGNLLGNAIQYRHPERPARIWISSEEDVDRWVLRIKDNGIGIPEADLPKLFQRFVRGSNTGGISGTGLGLHITREIMLGHGGDAWVESEEGEGTSFYLALPYEPIQPPHSSVSDVDEAMSIDDEQLAVRGEHEPV